MEYCSSSLFSAIFRLNFDYQVTKPEVILESSTFPGRDSTTGSGKRQWFACQKLLFKPLFGLQLNVVYCYNLSWKALDRAIMQVTAQQKLGA